MASLNQADVIIIGGGIVGTSIAWGLARRGTRVCVLDEGDEAFRAARGNFGLIWVQGKGAQSPSYATWTRRAALAWPDFATALQTETGIDLQHEQRGGFSLCLTETELNAACVTMQGIAESLDGAYEYELLEAEATRLALPAAGPAVRGSVYCPRDGQVSPQRLLRALFTALAARGATVQSGAAVLTIRATGEGFRVETAKGRYIAERIVLAAGLGNRWLAPLVGLEAPVAPQRGQVLITERVAPFLSHPTMQVRQTGDGTVQIGDTKEWVGFDDGITHGGIGNMAARAVACFPALASVKVVRTWGALRVMTPDGLPLYESSAEHPKAFLVTCHSGITLAANHAGPIADWILGGAGPAEIATFRSSDSSVGLPVAPPWLDSFPLDGGRRGWG
ncbi:MAG: FAD-binding oxidoreductase [Betaproteobacteria bacterium]|nr:FAD-binding oxidoreductase [Betaproteobacteria bacterium]